MVKKVRVYIERLVGRPTCGAGRGGASHLSHTGQPHGHAGAKFRNL